VPALMNEQFARSQVPDAPGKREGHTSYTPSRDPGHDGQAPSTEQGAAPSGTSADPGRPARPVRNSNPKHVDPTADYTDGWIPALRVRKKFGYKLI
jgi:hypothetical protein